MSEETSKNLTKRVNRHGSTGIVIGTLSILACELPIVLALVGLMLQCDCGISPSS